jgi:hypothetical protein
LKIIIYFIIGLSFIILFFPAHREGFEQMQYITDNPSDFINQRPIDSECDTGGFQSCNSLHYHITKNNNIYGQTYNTYTYYYPKNKAAFKKMWKALYDKKNEYKKNAAQSDINVNRFINIINSYNKQLQKDITTTHSQIETVIDQMYKFHTNTILQDTTSDIGKIYKDLQDLKKRFNMIKHSNIIATYTYELSKMLPSSKNSIFVINPKIGSISEYTNTLRTTIYDSITATITKISTFINITSEVDDRVKEYFASLISGVYYEKFSQTRS